MASPTLPSSSLTNQGDLIITEKLAKEKESTGSIDLLTVVSTFISHQDEKIILFRLGYNHTASEYCQIQGLKRLPEKDEIDALFTTINSLPEETKKQLFQKKRLNFLVHLLLLTGLRAHEVKLRWNQFQLVQGRWWLMVLGKGQKFRSIPINDELLSEIKNYRACLGKLPYPLPDESLPVITKFQSNETLSTRRINMLIQDLATLTASQFNDNPLKADRLRHIGVHGFRHIYSSLQDQAGIQRTQIRENLGHSNLSTTEIYLHSNDIKRHESFQKISVK